MADLDTLGIPEMTDTAKGKGAKSSNAGSGMVESTVEITDIF